MDTTEKSLTSLALCYGSGGLDRGLESAVRALRHEFIGERWTDNRIIRHAAIMEIEAFAAYNVVAQMENGVLDPCPVWTDLTTFPWEQFYGKVHILTGGYPCQPFSSAGLQGGVADPRHLFPFIERGVDAVRPVLCWFENVANHLNIGYEEVRWRLSRLGYKAEAGIYAAADVGAPHLRKRLFILAVADAYCNESGKKRGDLKKMLGIPESQRKSEHSSTLSGRNGIELGNADDQGQSQQFGTFGESWRRTVNASENVDHTIHARLEGQRRYGSARKRWEDTVRSIASTSVWPAGQGPEQFEWEEPRLESRMGSTINGYDFTEDLLRMEGNAVVEQQAELAFRTLIQKFL